MSQSVQIPEEQRSGSSLISLKCPLDYLNYRLQCVYFVASRLTLFTALPRTMHRSNAKLSEGV